jgi:hypothetical protein
MTLSVDTTHEAGSTVQMRNDLDTTIQPLQLFQKVGREWVGRPFQFNTESKTMPPLTCGDPNVDKSLADLLYPLQKLRKIGGED